MFSSDLLEYISRTTKELEDDSVNFLIDKAFRLNLKLLKQIQEIVYQNVMKVLFRPFYYLEY